ncbi:TPA: hypothetical protein ACY4F6_001598, partial [Enterococcus faecium 1,230,933]
IEKVECLILLLCIFTAQPLSILSTWLFAAIQSSLAIIDTNCRLTFVSIMMNTNLSKVAKVKVIQLCWCDLVDVGSHRSSSTK